MFKKKKRKEFKEIKVPFKNEDKKKPDIPVRIKEEDNYVVLEPFDLSKQTTRIPKKLIQIKKKLFREEVKPKKPEEIRPIKPKIIIKRVEPKEAIPKKPEVVKPKLIIQKVLPKPPEKITKPEEPMSEIPINHIETDIDKLMRIIDEKKVVGLEYLSKALKISVERLEIWAKMLEDRDLIEIEYPILGLPKLRKKECKKES